MKDFRKNIPTLLGFLGSASLAAVTSGITVPGLIALSGNIGVNVASSLLMEFRLGKVMSWVIDTHPNDLNHSIKKLFIRSIQEALYNINILYSETNATKQEKKEVKKVIQTLIKELPKQLADTTQIKIGDAEVEKILKASGSDENYIVSFISKNIDALELAPSFNQFFGQHLMPQIQLCFGEGLKNPANSEAWVAFQRMTAEGIQNKLNDIEASINGLKVSSGSAFSEKDMEDVRQLKEILQNKELIKLNIENSLTESLAAIKEKEDKLFSIAIQTNQGVIELKQGQKKSHIFGYLSVIVPVVLVIAIAIGVFYFTTNTPFSTTIQVYGWEGKGHNPLDGKGALVLTLGDKTEKAEINRSGEAVFNGILPKYNGATVPVYITDTEGEPYYLLAETVVIEKNATSPIQLLLQGLEKLQGAIYDDLSGEGLAGVLVTVADIRATTDANGNFSIDIPIEKQQKEQKIVVSKEGYDSKRETISMTGKYNAVLKQRK